MRATLTFIWVQMSGIHLILDLQMTSVTLLIFRNRENNW